MSQREFFKVGTTQALIDAIKDNLDIKADKTGTYSTLIAGGTTPDSVTDAMLAQSGGVYSEVYDLKPLALPSELSNAQKVKVDLTDGGKLYYGTHNVAELLGIMEVESYTYNGITISVSGNTVTASGTASGNVSYCIETGQNELPATIAAITLGIPEQDYTMSMAVTRQGGTYVPSMQIRKKDNSGTLAMTQNNTAQFAASDETCGGVYVYFQKDRAYDLTFVIGLLPYETTVTDPYRSETSEVTAIDVAGTYSVSGYVWSPDEGTSASVVESRVAQAARRCVMRYSTREIPYTGATEVLDVYLPCAGGFSHVIFAHTVTVDEGGNGDSWRIVRFFAADASFTDKFAITTMGETEMALKISGRDDFIGGYTHGDEVMVSGSLAFIMDGRPVDVSTLTDYTEFVSLKVVETTTLYDPSDHTTVVGKHGREYAFDNDGIDLLQTVIWSGAYTLDGSYMPMVCAIRGNDSTSATQITDTYFDDGSFELYDVSSPNFGGYPKSNKTDVRRMVLYSDVSNVCITCDIESQTELTGHASFLYDGDAYNKIYNGVCGVTTQHTTQAGEKWQTRARLTFEVGE